MTENPLRSVWRIRTFWNCCNTGKIPSLDKSTYGFCRQKCSLTLCVALTGQPACRSALPQAAFLPRKNSVGLFGEGKSDDDKEENRRNTCVFQGSMTQSALICTWGPRKVARPCGVRRTHHSGEGCPLGSARLKRRLRPTKKRVCPCQTKVTKGDYK